MNEDFISEIIISAFAVYGIIRLIYDAKHFLIGLIDKNNKNEKSEKINSKNEM